MDGATSHVLIAGGGVGGAALALFLKKETVSPVPSRIRNTMIKLILRLATEKSDRWLFGYQLDWNYKAL